MYPVAPVSKMLGFSDAMVPFEWAIVGSGLRLQCLIEIVSLYGAVMISPAWMLPPTLGISAGDGDG